MDINYLSDDDEKQKQLANIKYSENDDYNNYLPYEENEDEELDEDEIEYLKQQHEIIMNAANKKSLFDTNIFSFEEKEKKRNKELERNKEIERNKELEKNKEKDKNMNVKEFNKYIDNIIKEKQPKKFISKRSLEKKKISDSETNNQVEYKRTFNPRLPPYFEVHKRYDRYDRNDRY